MDSSRARCLLLVGSLWQTEGGHNLIECFSVFIDQMQQLLHQHLTLIGPSRELCPTVVPSALVAREVGDHRAEGCTQRTHIG